MWYVKEGFAVCEFCFPNESFSAVNTKPVRKGRGFYGACVVGASSSQAIFRHQMVCKNKPRAHDTYSDDEIRVCKASQVSATATGTPESDRIASGDTRTSGQTKFDDSESEVDANVDVGNAAVQAVVLCFLHLNAGFAKVSDDTVRMVLDPFFKANGLRAIGPRRLSSECERLSNNMRSAAYESMRGKSVLVLLDGGTINRRTLLNVCLACGRQILFWKSLRVATLSADVVKQAVQEIVNDLRGHGSYPIGCVTDNASAMLKAVREAAEIDPQPIIDATVEMSDDHLWTQLAVPPPKIDGFWVPVSCWAHTLQLCIGDVVKRDKNVAKAFEVVSRLGEIPRASRNKLEGIQKEAGEKPKALILGCDTRWNSKVRACVRIMELSPFLAVACPELHLSGDELYSLAITSVALTPLAWATDSVQSDKCVITKANAIIETTKAHYVTLVACAPLSSLNDVVSVVEEVKRSLNVRWPKMNNLFIQLTKYFDPSLHDNCLTHEQVQKLVESYWAPRKSDSEMITISDEVAVALRKYATRSLSDEKHYWSRNAVDAPHLVKFKEDISSCITTEGAVERSFATEGRLFGKSRVALSEANCEHRTFVQFNSNKQKRPRVERSEDLSVEEWLRMVSQLDPIAPVPRYNLRSRQPCNGQRETGSGIVRDLTDVTKGTVIEVQWVTEGVLEWHECVVLEKIGQKYSVFYSTKGARKSHKGDFNPAVDTVWRFAANPEFQ